MQSSGNSLICAVAHRIDDAVDGGTGLRKPMCQRLQRLAAAILPVKCDLVSVDIL